MTIQRRLLLGFVVILSLFLANLAIHRWRSRRRDERFEALRQATARSAALTNLQ